MWVPGLKLRPSEFAAQAFTHWAICWPVITGISWKCNPETQLWVWNLNLHVDRSVLDTEHELSYRKELSKQCKPTNPYSLCPMHCTFLSRLPFKFHANILKAHFATYKEPSKIWIDEVDNLEMLAQYFFSKG